MWTSRAGWLSALSQWANGAGFAASKESAGVKMEAPTLLAVAAGMIV